MKDFEQSEALRSQRAWERLSLRTIYIGSLSQKLITTVGVLLDSCGVLSVVVCWIRHEPVLPFLALCATLRCVAQWIFQYKSDRKMLAVRASREEMARSQLGCAYYEGASDSASEMAEHTISMLSTGPDGPPGPSN